MFNDSFSFSNYLSQNFGPSNDRNTQNSSNQMADNVEGGGVLTQSKAESIQQINSLIAASRSKSKVDKKESSQAQKKQGGKKKLPANILKYLPESTEAPKKRNTRKKQLQESDQQDLENIEKPRKKRTTKKSQENKKEKKQPRKTKSKTVAATKKKTTPRKKSSVSKTRVRDVSVSSEDEEDSSGGEEEEEEYSDDNDIGEGENNNMMLINDSFNSNKNLMIRQNSNRSRGGMRQEYEYGHQDDLDSELGNMQPDISNIQSQYHQSQNPQNNISSQLHQFERNYDFADAQQWTTSSFPWSNRLLPTLEYYYGYSSFRPNQKAIINATLSGRDVFCCMPTGGGKSLTFQLPAILNTGVTIVIMPLLALIYDQVTQLANKSISALDLSSWGGSIKWSEFEQLLGIYEKNSSKAFSWNLGDDFLYPKVIFTTPEKLSNSGNLIRFMKALHQMKLLDRFIIDEAHCVSQWGHDFRKDYLNLGMLRENFPNVPLLSLTATAPEKVRKDVIKNLKMQKVLYFQNSFNRENLYFEVKPKTKEIIEDIAEFIKTTYNKKSGIIYTTTIKEAEKVAKTLRDDHKMLVECYHASLSDSKRHKIHNDWLNDDIHIVVATIAFGMGINKLDVRFVIHYCFSKSIAHYYQEAGRAGRDGMKAHCLLYYKYADKGIHYFLSSKNQNTTKKKEESRWELQNVIKYCEDNFVCRRTMLLSYFGEEFDRSRCNKECDNCRADIQPVAKDFTEDAKKIIKFILDRNKRGFTLIQATQILKGNVKEKKKKRMMNDESKGCCSHLTSDEIERIIKELLYKRLVTEKMKKMGRIKGVYAGLLTTTQIKANKLLRNEERLIVNTLPPSYKKEEKKKSSKQKKAQEEKKQKGSALDRQTTLKGYLQAQSQKEKAEDKKTENKNKLKKMKTSGPVLLSDQAQGMNLEFNPPPNSSNTFYSQTGVPSFGGNFLPQQNSFIVGQSQVSQFPPSVSASSNAPAIQQNDPLNFFRQNSDNFPQMQQQRQQQQQVMQTQQRQVNQNFSLIQSNKEYGIPQSDDDDDDIVFNIKQKKQRGDNAQKSQSILAQTQQERSNGGQEDSQNKKNFKKNSKSKSTSKKYVFSKTYGYCENQDQFEEILDRLKLIRKKVFSEKKDSSSKLQNPDSIIPIEGLYELCRKLPQSMEDFEQENIKNVSKKQIQAHGAKFLSEISYFIRVSQINKEEFEIPADIKAGEKNDYFNIQEHMMMNNNNKNGILTEFKEEQFEEFDFGGDSEEETPQGNNIQMQNDKKLKYSASKSFEYNSDFDGDEEIFDFDESDEDDMQDEEKINGIDGMKAGTSNKSIKSLQYLEQLENVQNRSTKGDNETAATLPKKNIERAPYRKIKKPTQEQLEKSQKLLEMLPSQKLKQKNQSVKTQNMLQEEPINCIDEDLKIALNIANNDQNSGDTSKFSQDLIEEQRRILQEIQNQQSQSKNKKISNEDQSKGFAWIESSDEKQTEVKKKNEDNGSQCQDHDNLLKKIELNFSYKKGSDQKVGTIKQKHDDSEEKAYRSQKFGNGKKIKED